MPSDRPRGCQRLSALASHVRRRCLCCEAQPSIADAAVHGGIQMDPEKAMAEMNERDKFMLDCMGYLVVPEFLTHAEVDALNDAFDANWHRCELGAGNAKRRAIDMYIGAEGGSSHQRRGKNAEGGTSAETKGLSRRLEGLRSSRLVHSVQKFMTKV